MLRLGVSPRLVSSRCPGRSSVGAKLNLCLLVSNDPPAFVTCAVGGVADTNHRGPAFRKGARNPDISNMSVSFSVVSLFVDCTNLPLKDEVQAPPLSDSLSDLV